MKNQSPVRFPFLHSFFQKWYYRSNGMIPGNTESLKRRKQFIIETHELEQLLEQEKNCLLLDTSGYNILSRRPESQDATCIYDSMKKIKNTVNFDSEVTNSCNENFRHLFPSKEEFFDNLKNLLLLNTLPITSLDHLHIVIYEHQEIFFAPRIWLMFMLFGFDQVKILNGGLNKWIAEQREVIEMEKKHKELTDEAKVIKIENMITDFLEKNNKKINASLKQVYKYVDLKNLLEEKDQNLKGNYCIVDTRPSDAFHSSIKINDEKEIPNHVRYSINIPYTEMLQTHNGNIKYVTFKENEEWEKLFQEHKLLDKEIVIVSLCNKGFSASILLFILCILNVPITNLILYAGSMSEYNFLEY